MAQYNNEEMFKLSNGKCINDDRLSAIMYKLEEIQPEKAYQDDFTGFTWDESGLADLFSVLYENDTRYCAEHKSWYTYENGVWKKDIQGLLVSAKVKEFVRLLALYCGEISDETTRNEYMKFLIKTGDRRFRDRMIKDAEDCLRIEAGAFDNHPYLINCINGTFDLNTMNFREHDPLDFLTMSTNFSFSNQWVEFKCERWEKFIDEVTQGDKDKANFLQRALGYTLLGTANEECMFILHGKTTRNGKSTLLNTIEYLLGDYSCVAPVELICRNGTSKNAENASPILASLKGKRMVTMAESDSSGKIDESVLKQYTGGESIVARELYSTPFSFTPQFTLWLSCNDLPAVRDKSIFASERMRVVEFNRHFTQEEQDKTLKTYFESEEAHKGIFAWLISGYKMYLKDGLRMSGELRSVIKQYERDNDIIINFLEDCCIVDKDSRISAKNLYDQYKIWCRSNNYMVISAKKFNAEFRTHVDWYESIVSPSNKIHYTGIRMRTGDE